MGGPKKNYAAGAYHSDWDDSLLRKRGCWMRTVHSRCCRLETGVLGPPKSRSSESGIVVCLELKANFLLGDPANHREVSRIERIKPVTGEAGQAWSPPCHGTSDDERRQRRWREEQRGVEDSNAEDRQQRRVGSGAREPSME